MSALFLMADPTRLELATSAVTGQRSNQLSYESNIPIITYFPNNCNSKISPVTKANFTSIIMVFVLLTQCIDIANKNRVIDNADYCGSYHHPAHDCQYCTNTNNHINAQR